LGGMVWGYGPGRGEGTSSVRNDFRGLEIGVDVKRGYFSGLRSGEVELSVGEEDCGVNSRGSSETARGGRVAD